MNGLVHLLFFLSGASGLIYQVVWVRVFGNVFGNTIYSAALVVAVFMLGLGAGSYVAGRWADRRYETSPASLLRAYGVVEVAIAALGLGISLVLPHLVAVSSLVSSYTREPDGWYALSTGSFLARVVVALVLLVPVTVLMGGTLTLLIRHLVGGDVEQAGRRISLLYAVNTAGAAVGCLLTDFSLVPRYGLLRTQLVAVALNASAAAGALLIAARSARALPRPSRQGVTPRVGADERAGASPRVALTSLALVMSGFAALGMEIIWFRHFTILLGQFRAVFSLLLALILLGIGIGALAAGLTTTTRARSRGARPAVEWFTAVQALFIAATLAGLAANDVPAIDAGMTDPAVQIGTLSEWTRARREFWFNAWPMLVAVAVPSLLMGFSFPLANAIVQRAERTVGRRAGVLYLANTIGGVGGSLAAGFWLLPGLGIQATALVLTCLAALSVVPLHVAGRWDEDALAGDGARAEIRRRRAVIAGSLVVAAVSIGAWWRLPSDFVIARALPRLSEGGRLLAVDEGLNEVIAVTEVAGRGRRLLTNGHPMSSTEWMSQRYMRALAHIPLLSMNRPQSVLVIGFGVGNTTHAASLHPSVRRVDVADLSRDILEHARFFEHVNMDVLDDPRVRVFLNDGRHHLQMMPEGSYDLVTLEPPPIAYAGVAALYSREFYALARSRLTPAGYVSQWLPTNQVPASTALAMTRAFIEVFPGSVLISGAEADLLLLGTRGDRLEIDPVALLERLRAAPAVRADLARFDLDTVHEIVGSFVGSARTLAEATSATPPVTDDRPIQEYGVRSLLDFRQDQQAPLVDLTQVAAWCPRCFEDGRLTGPATGLDVYLALMDRAYLATRSEIGVVRTRAAVEPRRIADSAYLGAVVPETADVHTLLGVALASRGNVAPAIDEFRRALALDPRFANAHWRLGALLAAQGSAESALEHLETAVELDPGNGRARRDLAWLLLEQRRVDAALPHLQAAVRLMPDSAEAHNQLGVALGWQGNTAEAIARFERALALNPGLAEARRNLDLARGLASAPGRRPGR
jgi:spermidine synthase/tetratricopeptide (TPR) repeat protein